MPMNTLNPQKFGFSPATIVLSLPDGRICLVIDRKSRIIGKDGVKIAEKAHILRHTYPQAEICFATSAPICSTTKNYLEEKGIALLNLEAIGDL